jgi:hypothetical protein
MNVRAAALVTLALAGPAVATARDARTDHFAKKARFEVKVTNVTRDQRFTPFLVVAHRPSVRLFELGRPASDGLTSLAEEGMTGPLQATLDQTPGVSGTATSTGLLEPGKTATIEVEGAPHDVISLAAMLIPTNDGFVAVNAVGPIGRYGRMVMAPAYDAGTEQNDETCANIPGPDFEECGGPGTGGQGPSDPKEGFVRIHEGIHGVGDLNAATRDWRNPVAKVTIRRIR